MENNRINEIVNLTLSEIKILMAKFDAKLDIRDFKQMGESMSNTGYKVVTNAGVFLLKIYSSGRDKLECAMYRYLRDRVPVPKLYLYDNTRRLFPLPYAVFEFLEGMTLAEYLRKNRCFPTKLSYEIGGICAEFHNREYSHNGSLNDKLRIKHRLPDFCKKLRYLLREKSATYLKPETVSLLKEFMKHDIAQFDRINADSVLSHGDFNCWNIMIVDERAYCIDFEYTCSDSRYRDIGNLFRRKDESIESLMNEKVYLAFADGYNNKSQVKLPTDWLRIARICDIVTMLGLFLNEHFPKEWIPDIEADILSVIR